MSEKRVIEVNISEIDSFFKGLKGVQFCRETCPVPKKTWSCGCRPMKHQNECQILKAYNKRSGK